MVTSNTIDFQEIYDTYQPRILHYLIGLVGAEAAEDLSQEVFLRASQGLNSFRGEAKVSTWLYRIATNAAIDRSRSARFKEARREISLEYPCEKGAEENINMPGRGNRAIEQALLEKDRLHCFIGYVRNMPLNYRAILLLSEIEEFTTIEIAQVLDLSHETVKIRLHRGRARLFQALREHCKPEEWL